MSNARKKQFKLQKPAEPRAKEEIQKDYAQTMTDLANNSYMHYLYGIHVDSCQENMLALNRELKERNELDAKQAEKGEKNETSKPQS